MESILFSKRQLIAIPFEQHWKNTQLLFSLSFPSFLSHSYIMRAQFTSTSDEISNEIHPTDILFIVVQMLSFLVQIPFFFFRATIHSTVCTVQYIPSSYTLWFTFICTSTVWIAASNLNEKKGGRKIETTTPKRQHNERQSSHGICTSKKNPILYFQTKLKIFHPASENLQSHIKRIIFFNRLSHSRMYAKVTI